MSSLTCAFSWISLSFEHYLIVGPFWLTTHVDSFFVSPDLYERSDTTFFQKRVVASVLVCPWSLRRFSHCPIYHKVLTSFLQCGNGQLMILPSERVEINWPKLGQTSRFLKMVTFITSARFPPSFGRIVEECKLFRQKTYILDSVWAKKVKEISKYDSDLEAVSNEV